MTNPKKEKIKVAEEALEKIDSADKSTSKDLLLSLVPSGVSPKLYITTCRQLMGTDRSGNERPAEDLMYFMLVANRIGLDPTRKQIYAVYRWDSREGKDKMSIQTGIDGFRLIAQRSDKYAGQDEVVYEPEDESLQHPLKATVTVYKIIGGVRVPFTATARWSEYVPLTKEGKPQGLWVKMPYLMLGKCAESLALRKAFPSELSGLYTDSEMQQTNNSFVDLPKPIKTTKTAGVLQDNVKVIHGSPVVSEKDLHIGTDESKKVSEELKKKEKDEPNTMEVKPTNDVVAIRKKIEEMQKREAERNGKKD